MSGLVEGDIFQVNEGGSVTVVKYVNYQTVKVKFNDEYGYETVTNAGNIKKGSLKNPFRRSVVGVGFFGVGVHLSSIDGKKCVGYAAWISMLNRCYNEKQRGRHPTYSGWGVHEEWHNFQNFAEWWEAEPKELGWALDKDIMADGSNTYSPATCCIVPQEINSILTGRDSMRGDYPKGVYFRRGRYHSHVSMDGQLQHIGVFVTEDEAVSAYREAKEAYVRRVAERWAGRISPAVYEKLINYKEK